MRLISAIQNNITIDNIKYAQNFEYMKSSYSLMSFPEIGDIDLFRIVDNPPANSSETTIDELQIISRMANNRSQQDIDLVYQVDYEPLGIFYPVIEENNLVFDENLFFTSYYKCVSAIIDHLKFFYNRARPFQIAEHHNIHIDRIITKTHKTPSYPSGHTMYAALAAAILTDDYPEHKTKFDALVDQCGTARVLQGVHYPSDNEASKRIMSTIYPSIKSYFTQRRKNEL
jgi:hypothetical protein